MRDELIDFGFCFVLGWILGMANICLITNHTTIIRQRIDVPVPRKRKGGSTALGADKVRCFPLLLFQPFYTYHFEFLYRHTINFTLKFMLL